MGSGYTPCKDCSSGLQTAVKVLDSLTFGAGATYGRGSGKCTKCGGSGEITCKKCDGSGECTTCTGSGRVTCSTCDGSGNCPECDNGQVTCSRCEGSGNYQTFIRQTSTLYAKRWRWANSSPYRDLVATSYGTNIYGGPVKVWSNAKTLHSDNEPDAHRKCINELGNESQLFDEFISADKNASPILGPDNGQDRPYSKSLVAQRVPVTEINYTINGENYQMVIVGNNNLVAVKNIPTVIKGYELNLWQRIKLALTYKKRLKAFACLAAYIFQCDGKSPEESKVLNAMVDELHLSGSAKEKFRERLHALNTPIPYEEFRKTIKPLLTSKKTITFAWQCMAVDKKITPQEQELFEKIVGEYKLSPEEIQRLQAGAQKFSRLKNDQIAKEYGDLSDSLTKLRRKIYKIAAGTACVIALAGYGIYEARTSSDDDSHNDHLTESIEDKIAEARKTIEEKTKEANRARAEHLKTIESSMSDATSHADGTVALTLDGNVGKYPVKMELNLDLDGKTAWGSYAYTKTGGGDIILKGSIDNVTGDEYSKTVHVILHELDNEGNPTGVLDINASLAEFGNSVNGEYTSPKGKTFTIVLSES